MFQHSPSPTRELPAMPIEPSSIKEGNPVACGTIALQSKDKKLSSGLWSCQPGKFEWHYTWEEFVHLLEGEVDVTEVDTGHVITLRPGDMAHFPLGMKTLWHVKEPIRKFFVINSPESLEV